MSLSSTKSGSARLPAGYVAIPIAEDQKAAVLKICVLVKPDPDPVAGHLVVLRDTLEAKVFLGCIIDTAGPGVESENRRCRAKVPYIGRLHSENTISKWTSARPNKGHLGKRVVRIY